MFSVEVTDVWGSSHMNKKALSPAGESGRVKFYNQDNEAVNPCYCGQLLPWLGGAGVRGVGWVAWVLTSWKPVNLAPLPS